MVKSNTTVPSVPAPRPAAPELVVEVPLPPPDEPTEGAAPFADPSAGSATAGSAPSAPLTMEAFQTLLAQQQQAMEIQAQLINQVQSLQATVAQQSQRLSQHGQAAAPRSAPTLLGGGFDDAEMFWIRIKPCDKSRGLTRRRQFCDELGFTARGGTGLPGDIPQWYPVSPEVAQRLARYRQDDGNPESPPVFDIVTPEERDELDRWEEAHRMSALGIGAPPSSFSLQQAARRTQHLPPQLPTRRAAPSLLPGAAAAQHAAVQAEQFAALPPQALQVIRGPQVAAAAPLTSTHMPPMAQYAPAQVASAQTAQPMMGRMAAMQGLPAASPAPESGKVNVAMDFAAEAAASPEIGQLVSTSQAVAAQARQELGRDPMRPFSPR